MNLNMQSLFQALTFVVVLSIGPALSILSAQGCNKTQGLGGEVQRGLRYSTSCINSGFVNYCHWVDCTATVNCYSGERGRFTCGPGSFGFDALNDSCWFFNACGCSYDPACRPGLAMILLSVPSFRGVQ